jgi:hypothetical protein
MAGDDVVGCRQAQVDRLGRDAVADHHGVANGLDDLAAGGRRDVGDRARELGRELGGVGVAVGLGQSGVAGYVGEDEGSGLVLWRSHPPTVLPRRVRFVTQG